MDEWNQVPIKDFKSGEIIWECESGLCIELEVVDDPFETEWGWNIPVRTPREERSNFGHAHGYPHYGPKLYRRPVYGKLIRLTGKLEPISRYLKGSNDE